VIDIEFLFTNSQEEKQENLMIHAWFLRWNFILVLH